MLPNTFDIPGDIRWRVPCTYSQRVKISQLTGRKGISIAETLISVFLLALLLIVFFNLFPTTVLANRQGSQQMQATTLAQSVLAQARTRQFDDLIVGFKETGTPQRIEGTDYRADWEVQKADAGDPDQLKVLVATVSWTANNRAKSLQERIWIHRVMEE